MALSPYQISRRSTKAVQKVLMEDTQTYIQTDRLVIL
jgi:hypothetical protein